MNNKHKNEVAICSNYITSMEQIPDNVNSDGPYVIINMVNGLKHIVPGLISEVSLLVGGQRVSQL